MVLFLVIGYFEAFALVAVSNVYKINRDSPDGAMRQHSYQSRGLR
jgi:hypothetical protein